MLFSWLRNRRRRKLLALPCPAGWQAVIERCVPHYPRLPQPLQLKLCDIARVIVAEKYWEGCAGLVVTEEMKVTIASQAAMLLLGIEHDYYARVLSILVYPSSFLTARPEENTDEPFVPDKAVMGQAVYRGPVILAWDEVLRDGQQPELGQNVVFHEFAHQIDFLDDSVDGVPPLATFKERKRWIHVMNDALEKHREALAKRRHTFFNSQTAESRTELFAYATEMFFCSPMELAAEYDEVFALLLSFYRVDPRVWLQ